MRGPKNFLFLLTIFEITIIFPSILLAQTDSTYIKTEEILEDVLVEPDEDQDNSDLYEAVEQLLINPIELNSSSVSELQEIPGLDGKSASLILNHKIKYGNFFSVEELNAVEGLDRELITRVKPFLTVNKQPIIKPVDEIDTGIFDNMLANSKIRFRSRFNNDLQKRKGFADNSFQGSPLKSYNRLMISYENTIQMGALFEKDPGENDFNEFSSYHLAIKETGIINQAVIGDYLIEFGQGLALWSPYGFSKGADAIYPVKKRTSRIRPHTSATENNFLRGAAGSIMIFDFNVSAFFSKNKFDANIDPLTGDILSTPVDGYHRTIGELSRKKTANETIIGSSIEYSHALLNTGILHYQSKFSNNFLPSSIYDLSGEKFNYTSVYYDLTINNLNFFGEAAFNGTSVASINSLSFYIGRDFSFVTSLRSYPRNYISLHGYAFGERSGATSNEVGIYTGIKLRTPVGILNFYYDQFKFPYSTYSNTRPGSGDEFLAELVNKSFLRFETKFRYKYEYKDVPISINDKKEIAKRLKQLFRVEVIYYPAKTIRLKGRFDFNKYNLELSDNKEHGYSLLQDIRYSPNQNLNLYLRIIFYKTDSFNSAIYEYENDLTGVLTNRALFGEGIRWYFVLRYRPFRLITLSLKYSETYKPGENTISSGLSEIENDVDNRISVQVDLKF